METIYCQDIGDGIYQVFFTKDLLDKLTGRTFKIKDLKEKRKQAGVIECDIEIEEIK
ncbi:MAG: hypothetical protein PVJ60_00620 [Phycisphaerales bacterium]|jgi:hypothetical protein